MPIVMHENQLPLLSNFFSQTNTHAPSSLSYTACACFISSSSQEPTLFNISIRDNIAYGDVTTECTFEEVQAAARLSQADNFITTLPDGYETNCGEGGGSQMSGGQKQVRGRKKGRKTDQILQKSRQLSGLPLSKFKLRFPFH